jgi:hypothetical protein
MEKPTEVGALLFDAASRRCWRAAPTLQVEGLDGVLLTRPRTTREIGGPPFEQGEPAKYAKGPSPSGAERLLEVAGRYPTQIENRQERVEAPHFGRIDEVKRIFSSAAMSAR